MSHRDQPLQIIAGRAAPDAAYELVRRMTAPVGAIPGGMDMVEDGGVPGLREARLSKPLDTPDVDERQELDTAIAPPWLTILHNCDCHTFEEVVRQLIKAIACSEERGWEIAWEVHNTGKAVVKVGPEADCVRVGNVLASIGLVVTVVQS